MSASPEESRKPLYWVSSSKKDMQALPEGVKDVFGKALLDIQYGDIPASARPFGEGVRREVWKLVDDDDGDTYRAAYTVQFDKAVYVLDVFMKKSKTGIGTPKMIRDRIAHRYDLARKHYDETYLKPKKT